MLTKPQEQAMLSYVKEYITELEKQVRNYKERARAHYEIADKSKPDATAVEFELLNYYRDGIRHLKKEIKKFAAIAKNLKH